MKDYFRMKRKHIEIAEKIPRKHYLFIFSFLGCGKKSPRSTTSRFFGVLRSRIDRLSPPQTRKIGLLPAPVTTVEIDRIIIDENLMWERGWGCPRLFDPQKKCVTQVSVLDQTQMQFVLTFSFIIDVRLARRGQEASEQERGGRGEAAGFWRQKCHLSSTGYNLLTREHMSPSTSITQPLVKPDVWTYSTTYIVQNTPWNLYEDTM